MYTDDILANPTLIGFVTWLPPLIIITGGQASHSCENTL